MVVEVEAKVVVIEVEDARRVVSIKASESSLKKKYRSHNVLVREEKMRLKKKVFEVFTPNQFWIEKDAEY